MSLLGKLNLTESAELEFGLEVFGTTEKTSSIRFVLEGPEYDIVCHCKESNGTVTVNVPKLKGVLPSGVYESRLEIVIDDKIFTPLRESIEFNPLVEIGVEKKKVESIKEGVKVKVKGQVVAEEVKASKQSQLLAQLVDEGYEVVKMNNFNVIKKNSKYVGILGENNILKAKKEHYTLSDLVEELSN